jgi:hypothetical protein
VHEVTPVKHGLLFGEQLLPVAHVMHAPPLQTLLVAQGVPSATLLRPVHVDVPVEHDVVPVWHRLPLGLHESPVVQLTHAPEEHTWFVPQGVPSAALLPVSVQTMPPSAHVAVPLWQGLVDGAQADPLVHGAQPPSSQYRFAPHAVPLGAFPPVAQTGMPVEHVIEACWQEPASAQPIPLAQETQEPLSQTAPASHAPPFRVIPVGEHTVAPASLHTVTPVWHVPGMQSMPELHAPS